MTQGLQDSCSSKDQYFVGGMVKNNEVFSAIVDEKNKQVILIERKWASVLLKMILKGAYFQTRIEISIHGKEEK